MRWQYNDGGRAEAGFKGLAGDCVVRAIAIASQTPYIEVYCAIFGYSTSERKGKRKRGISHPRNGVYKNTTKKILADLGWEWHPKSFIGVGCTTHLREEELPKGRIIVSLSRHIAAVIDGVLHDTSDCSREGMRCVYGYWSKGENHDKN